MLEFSDIASRGFIYLVYMDMFSIFNNLVYHNIDGMAQIQTFKQYYIEPIKLFKH